MASQRKSGLDIIRTLAIIVVMITHTLNHTAIMDKNIRSPLWILLAVVKFISIIGVPLFLLLTGYLQSKREFNKKHYTSIIPVLLSYFTISAVSAGAQRYFLNSGRAFHYLVNILDYEYGYGWYVEMYIGLFLLIPFLNAMYKNISRKQKLWLIGFLGFLSFVPTAIQSVWVSEIRFEIFPDFFTNLYVFAYYFIGSYIAEYKPSPKKILCVGAIALTVAVETVLCYALSGTEYAWWLFNNVASLPHVIVAVCVFLIFYNTNISSKPIAGLVKKIASCSFEMYLISYMTDYFCHTYLSLPVWMIYLTDFAMAFVFAGIARLVLVPIGNFIKSLITKQ